MENTISHRTSCRGCFSKNIKKFLSLGNMPLAGGFLDAEQIKDEIKIPLDVYFCEDCWLVQILDVVEPSVLFKNYFYISSVIKSLSEHFEDYHKFLLEKYLDKKDKNKILEFGCNDGVLLQYFLDDPAIQAYGVDPSENVWKLAKEKWLNVNTGYFNQDFANNFKHVHGEFDVITGSNVFAHIDDIHEVLNAAKILLKNDWVFIIEVHYLGDLIKDFQYDTIYHEHLTYYSISSLKKIYEIAWFKIIDVIHIPMHGGGIRVVASKETSIHNVEDSVWIFLQNELEDWLTSYLSFELFWEKVLEHKKSLMTLLKNIKNQNKTIVWYWAPWRWTILLNFCWIDKKYLDYIVDVSPLRAGKLMPWVHLPILSPEVARQKHPDYFLILAWNYTNSILEQEQVLYDEWVNFIIPFAKPHIEWKKY